MNTRLFPLTLCLIALSGPALAQFPEPSTSLAEGAANALPEQQNPLPPVTLDLRNVPLQRALRTLLDSARASYFIDNRIPDNFITLKINNIPFEKALFLLLEKGKIVKKSKDINSFGYSSTNNIYYFFVKDFLGNNVPMAEYSVTCRLNDASTRKSLESLMIFSKKSFIISPEVKGLSTLSVSNMTFEKLVDIIIRSSSEPLSCTKENNVYKIQPASLPGNSALPVTKPISLDLKDASIRRAIDQLFKTANLPYTLDSAASGFVTLKSSNLSFEQALQLLLRTATVPLTYTRENGVYRIYPRDASPTPQTEGMPRPVTLDLANAPLRAALMQLFELANVNYSLPPDMQGTVTLKLSNVPFESALETLLRSSPTRLTYRKDEKAYVVEAAPVDPPTRDENTVIVLKHVTAPEMIRLLTPVRPDGIDWLLPVTARNALFVKSVDEDAVLQLRKLIQIFDAAPKELTLRAEVVTVDGQNRRSTLFSTLIVGRSGSTLVATDRTNGTPTTASRIKLTLIPTALESDLEVNSDWDISLPLPGSKGGVVRLEKGLAATTRLSPGQTTLVGGTTRKQHDLKEQILFFLTWEQPKNPGTSRVSL